MVELEKLGQLIAIELGQKVHMLVEMVGDAELAQQLGVIRLECPACKHDVNSHLLLLSFSRPKRQRGSLVVIW